LLHPWVDPRTKRAASFGTAAQIQLKQARATPRQCAFFPGQSRDAARHEQGAGVKDAKKKGSQPMPAVVRKLGPGVVVREKKEGEEPGQEQKFDYRPSDQVFRRQK
jgi:hypothetical protein